MTDRELLELAAKAAGMNIQRIRLDDPLCRDFLMNGSSPRNKGQFAFPWNPLTDDGDALRLAVRLGIDLLRTERDVEAVAGLPPHIKMDAHHISAPCAIELIGTDPYAATRRAIVRCAAEIGRTQEQS